MEITGLVDGDLLTIRVSDRFAGAVGSLTWRGKEFINIYDHGRQISYAWSYDYKGECLNPTEPGSSRDLFKQTSTSDLLQLCSSGPNQVTTLTQLAYWLAPGETGFCDSGTVSAVNTETLSAARLQKSITIGYGGIENVIAFDAVVTIAEDHSFFQAEIPTGYLTSDFTDYWRFDVTNNVLIRAEAEPLVAPWDFISTGTLPPILSTPDGAFAMGAYTAEDVVSYQILSYKVANPSDHTNKWNIVVQESPAPAGEYQYTTFAIVGTLDEVQAAMLELFALHPTDVAPPEGYIDVADCDYIAGWAWDRKAPDQPVTVEVFSVRPDGEADLLGEVLADVYRVDLEDALGNNGRHGFEFPTRRFFPEGEDFTVRVEAVNTIAGLSNAVLIPAERHVICN